MSALTATVKMLLAGSGVTALVGQRIVPGVPPQDFLLLTCICVHLLHDEEEELLQGASQWPEARVSIECRAATLNDADKIGEAVVNWLRDKDRYLIDGVRATFRKEGSDETDGSEESTQGAPTVSRRILDYYVKRQQPGL